MEVPLRKFGYKPIIIAGRLTVILALVFFSLWKSVWFWFFLRFLIGIGNNFLHFGLQTWITALSSERNRGLIFLSMVYPLVWDIDLGQ